MASKKAKEPISPNSKLNKNEKLSKALDTFAVFAFASGAMISSGLFILPSVIFDKVGPFSVFSYLVAALLVIPALFSQSELATAMPKSGGAYFFVQRSLGPLFGTFAGLASWFSIALKSVFALLGIGIFLTPLMGAFGESEWLVKILACIFTLAFMMLNLFSVKSSGRFQSIFLIILLVLLGFYIVILAPQIKIDHFKTPRPLDFGTFISSVGMIFVSFGGLTKIAAVAEEVKDPSRSLVKGMFSAFIVVSLLYVFIVAATTGVLSGEAFKSAEAPLNAGAASVLGPWAGVLMSIAGLLAFITTANAGILSASRNPMAMAKDKLLPGFMGRVSLRFKTPYVAIFVTSLFMLLVILFLDLETLVKAASTMMLILFVMVNISVILMRESKIISYRPAFRSPLYPLFQLIGIICYPILIFQMGMVPLVLSLGFFIISTLWYFIYSRKQKSKDSALIQVVERMTSNEIKSSDLSQELKEILIERDEIIEDRFDHLIKKASIINFEEELSRDGLFTHIAEELEDRLGCSMESVRNLLAERENQSSTSIYPGLAVPHIIIPGEKSFDIIVVRAPKGVLFDKRLPLVNIVFALAGSQDERNFHLQALMAIAQIIQNPDFEHNWMKTRNIEDLRNLILLAQRVRKGDL